LHRISLNKAINEQCKTLESFEKWFSFDKVLKSKTGVLVFIDHLRLKHATNINYSLSLFFILLFFFTYCIQK